EPLPKLRSIWESAASRAFDLSMEEPSTRRNAVVVIAPTPYRTGFAGPTTKGPAGEQCTRFVLSSQYVLSRFEAHISLWNMYLNRDTGMCAPTSSGIAPERMEAHECNPSGDWELWLVSRVRFLRRVPQ